MKKFLIISILYMHTLAGGSALEYGRAIQSAQSGDWQATHATLTKLLVDAPEQPDLLYDAGVSAYQLGEYEQAQAYFENVATQESAERELKERAYFNLGNTHVKREQLQDAIIAYEQVLEVNPNNERAQHNLDIVKKMLEQQQQEQQEKKQDQQQDQNTEQEKEQSEQNNSEQQSSDNNKQQQSEQQKQSTSEENGNQQRDTNNQERDSNSSQGEHNGQRDQQADSPDNNKQEQGSKEQFEQWSQQQEATQTEKQNGSQEHGSSPSEENIQESIDTAAQEGNQDGKKAGAAHDTSEQESPQDKYIKMILQAQEEADADANKRMMKRAIDKNLAGKHGQKRW